MPLINTCLNIQTTLTRDTSKNPSTVQSRGFIFLVWHKFLCSRIEFSMHTAPLKGAPSEQVGCSQAQQPSLFSLLMIIHPLVLPGLQEENRSCQEGVPESPGRVPGQPRLQGTATLTDGLQLTGASREEQIYQKCCVIVIPELKPVLTPSQGAEREALQHS